MSTKYKDIEEITYPESDGKPMADNTLQYEWIVKIKEGLEVELPNDFVAADLFWYPVQGNPKIVQAPDVMVAFGRPKGYRGSYKQWVEDNVVPQIVFEILSPCNTPNEMFKKLSFYNTHGVEEYYVYDPDRNELFIWIRRSDRLTEVDFVGGWTSPRLSISFRLSGDNLTIFHSNGEVFLSPLELSSLANQERTQKEEALVKLEQERAEKEKERAEKEKERAEKEKERAENQRFKEKLRQMGIDPETF